MIFFRDIFLFYNLTNSLYGKILTKDTSISVYFLQHKNVKDVRQSFLLTVIHLQQTACTPRCVNVGAVLPVWVSGALRSQSPGLGLQRQEAEQQAQPRRQQRTHGGAVETHHPGEEADLRRPKCICIFGCVKIQ